MLFGFGENPPQAIVDKELHTASNQGIPSALRIINKTIVKAKYKFQRKAAVDLIRGVNLPSVGPGDSAENICLPATANCGRTAINKTIIPIPPSHCVYDRQKNIVSGYLEKSVKIVAPVVVKPETASNKAFTGDIP